MAGKFVSPKAKESLMTDILVKLFVKDYKDVEKVSVRTAYGVLASGVGIFCNVLLTIAKMVIGILLHSVSVTADAFNNLSDAGSSIIGMIGVKMAENRQTRSILWAWQAGIHSGTDRILSGDRSWIYLFQKCDREDPGAGRIKIQSGVDPDPGVVHRCEAVACDV